MPRPEEPIDPAGGAVAEFAQRLRELRLAAGSPKYRQMAARTHYSHVALSKAARGKKLPTWPVVVAYLHACGIRVPDEIELLRQLWEDAVAARARLKSNKGAVPMTPQKRR